MAVDTKNKRASSLGRPGGFWLGPDPDADTSTADRGQALGLYSGIDAAEPITIQIVLAFTEVIIDSVSHEEIIPDACTFTEKIIDQDLEEETI